jgi:antitoxin component YwqK of YwqJK toxin-antitoxin module
MGKIIKLIFLMSFFLMEAHPYAQDKKYFYPDSIVTIESGVMFYDSLGKTYFICEYHNCVFENNTINGILYWYDEKKQIISFQTLENGIRNGVSIEYYDSSRIFRTMNFNNDELEGLYEELYINGQLRKTYYWVNNNYDGEFIYFKENGDTLEYIQYKNGKVNGSYIAFYPNGKRRFHLVEINGVCIRFVQYNRRGKIRKSSIPTVTNISF